MRFLKYLLLVLVALLVLGGVLLWMLPADFAYRQTAKYLGPVALSGVRGTLWNGHADGISVFGRDLGEIDWRMAKIPMLRGRLVADVRIRGTDVDAAGLVEREAPGALTLRDIRFRFPAHLLEPALDDPSVTLLGVISGAVSDASLREGFLESATGNARWSEAGVNAQVQARFADILADFAAQPNGGLAGNAHDDGTGNLAITANFRAGVDGFEVDALLRARNDDAQVKETLQLIGEPQPDGSSKLVVRGRLFKLY